MMRCHCGILLLLILALLVARAWAQWLDGISRLAQMIGGV